MENRENIWVYVKRGLVIFGACVIIINFFLLTIIGLKIIHDLNPLWQTAEEKTCNLTPELFQRQGSCK